MKKTSKYKVIPFKSKPLKAKIKDYTAVRVLSRIGKIFRRKWVNLTGGIVGAFRADKQEQIGNEIEAITKNIEDNKKLLDQFYKASQKNTQEDHKAATAVKKHIEKLEKRLLKLSKDQPNNSASLDLNQVLRNNLEPKAQEYLSDEELSQVFGDAPVKPIETAAPEAKPEPVPEAKPEPVQKSVDEKEALPELTPENVAEQVKKASED
ncbi:MAG: hypothetical protein PHI22_02660, partial [Bacilli bacterium]|nr:hypothetical protein [Bacilli bacterium]